MIIRNLLLTPRSGNELIAHGIAMCNRLLLQRPVRVKAQIKPMLLMLLPLQVGCSKSYFLTRQFFTQFKCWMCMTIRHSYRFQPLQIGLAYLSPKTRCVLCTFNTLMRLTIKYLYEILSLKNGLTKLFYFEHPTFQGEPPP